MHVLIVHGAADVGACDAAACSISVGHSWCMLIADGRTQGLSDLCWDPTSRYIATASDDFTLILWNADTGELLKSLKGHTHHVFCCAFSPNGNMLVSGSFDETIRLWDPLHGRCLKVRGAGISFLLHTVLEYPACQISLEQLLC